ncbi:MAG: LamG domain-containing protein, partial [Patescibacteria group bacterium]
MKKRRDFFSLFVLFVFIVSLFFLVFFGGFSLVGYSIFEPNFNDGFINLPGVLSRFIFEEVLVFNNGELTSNPDVVFLMHMNGDFSDSSSFGHSGEKSGNVDCNAGGKFGKGCYFDGNGDAIDFGQPSVLNFSGKSSFTLSVWVKPDADTSNDRIFGRMKGSEMSPGISLNNQRKYGAVWYNQNEQGRNVACNINAASDWAHVAFVNDGSLAKVFVNGQMCGFGEMDSVVGGVWGWRVGGTASSSYYYKGYLDEAVIFNRALSSSEVLELFNAGGQVTGCTENWKCGEWSNCLEGKQTRTCNELNNCGTVNNKPSVLQSCFANETIKCVENWRCEDWGACANGAKRRECNDINKCGSALNKPSSEMSCEGVCVEKWECSNLGECIGGKSRRTCTDVNKCGTKLQEPILEFNCEDATADEIAGGGLTKRTDDNISITGEISECRITRVSWTDKDGNTIRDANDSESVFLTVETSGCDGKKVDFEIFESDGFFGRAEKSKESDVIRNGFARKMFVVEWEEDKIFGVFDAGDPDLVFTASTNPTGTSGVLSVTQGVALAPGNVYYVDNSATATATCTNGATTYDVNSRSCGIGVETVYLTPQAAANRGLLPGESVLIRGGTYTIAPQFYCTPVLLIANINGVSGSPITFKAYQDLAGKYETVEIDAANTQDRAAWMHDSSYIVIDGLSFTGAPRQGLLLGGEASCAGGGVNNVIVKNSIAHDNGVLDTWYGGFAVDVVGRSSHDIIFDRSESYNNGDGFRIGPHDPHYVISTAPYNVLISYSFSHDNFKGYGNSNGFIFNNAYNSKMSHSVAFRNPDTGFGSQGPGADNNVFEYMVAFGATGANGANGRGFQVGNTAITPAVIGGKDNVIHHSYSFDNWKRGFTDPPAAQNFHYYHNTVFRNNLGQVSDYWGILMEAGDGQSGAPVTQTATLKNSVTYLHGNAEDMAIAAGAVFEMSNNLVGDGKVGGLNFKSGDPKFKAENNIIVDINLFLGDPITDPNLWAQKIPNPNFGKVSGLEPA